ncbi:MAG: AzlD domain-containing protein [Kaiparowitsia implicata GSE-PSE-MK54-09C]|jgi:branched-subunit amino acid transport protein AzlD|nr:AzlD domain-containing protein [Kaiparowitsia implicata GSE-PSE-MK54-09C]
MTLWWTIVFAGLGTYAMRSVGVWLPARWIPTRALTHLPLAVILVLTLNSLVQFTDTDITGGTGGTGGAIAASLIVLIARFKKLPLVLCIVLGCAVFGLFAT